MSPPAGNRDRNRAGRLFLVLGYVCVLGLALNLAVRLGWIHTRLPGLHGFAARWVWVLGATVCFFFAWYNERLRGGRPG
jgi:hypothetical protein